MIKDSDRDALVQQATYYKRMWEAAEQNVARVREQREAAEAELATAKARVAELEAALAAKAGYEAWMRAAKDLGAKLDVAESELADLRGRVVRATRMLNGPHSVTAVIGVLRG